MEKDRFVSPPSGRGPLEVGTDTRPNTRSSASTLPRPGRVKANARNRLKLDDLFASPEQMYFPSMPGTPASSERKPNRLFPANLAVTSRVRFDDSRNGNPKGERGFSAFFAHPSGNHWLGWTKATGRAEVHIHGLQHLFFSFFSFPKKTIEFTC